MTVLASGLNTANRACTASCQGNISLTKQPLAALLGMRKKIPGFEGLYEADDDGGVWSCWRPNMRGPRSLEKSDRLLSSSVSSNGYKTVSLCRGGMVYKRTVHSLIADAFFRPRRRLEVVDHIDGNRLNNSIQNLRIISHSANLARSKKTWGKNGYRGVVPRVNKNGTTSWRSYAHHNRRLIHIGTFASPQEAADARAKVVESLK